MVATLALCNDIDFADWDTYRAAHYELREEFGIDAEDSFWLFDPAGSEMALFKSSLNEKGPRHDELLADIQIGRLNILHAAGNFDFATTNQRPTRSMIADGLDYLAEHARVPEVWTNHGDTGNLQNIGWPGCTYQCGDNPAADSYVLDLLLQHGVRYFWTDRDTTNEFVEAPIVHSEQTRAGYHIDCFTRYRGALKKAPDAETLFLQLTDENLDKLIDEENSVVVYQHWCVHRETDGRPVCAGRPVFPESSWRSLKRLSEYRDHGKVVISRVADLLETCTPEKA